MKTLIKFPTELFLVVVLLLLFGCQKINTQRNPSSLSLSEIQFMETFQSKVIDIPNDVGGFQIDNPNFNFNDPSTWTGNIEKYVITTYGYEVNFDVKNRGTGTAFQTEVDLYLTYDSGEKSVKTVVLGDIGGSKKITTTENIVCSNEQLVGCTGTIFFYDY